VPLTPDEVRDQKITALEKAVRDLRLALNVSVYSLLAGVLAAFVFIVWIYATLAGR
jgi:nitrate reductase NapE component